MTQRFGRYQVVEKLRAGGMGEIYRAVARGTQGFAKPVIIKQIRGAAANDEDLIRRFVHEAKVMMTLNHRNLVQVLDLGRYGDTYYIAMEYVEGRDLSEVLAQCRLVGDWPSPVLSLYLVTELLRGVDYAHRAVDSGGVPLSIIHRDIKPGNLLCSFEGEVKLTDFGLARSLRMVTRGLALAGTYKYMSPEQAMGRALDQRSDLFAVGTILYLLLCRRLPFLGEHPDEVLDNICLGQTASPSALGIQVAGEIEAAMMKALARDPDDRFANAGAMLQALESYQRTRSPASSTDLRELMSRLFPAPPRKSFDAPVLAEWAVRANNAEAGGGVSVFDPVSPSRSDKEPTTQTKHDSPRAAARHVPDTRPVGDAAGGAAAEQHRRPVGLAATLRVPIDIDPPRSAPAGTRPVQPTRVPKAAGFEEAELRPARKPIPLGLLVVAGLIVAAGIALGAIHLLSSARQDSTTAAGVASASSDASRGPARGPASAPHQVEPATRATQPAATVDASAPARTGTGAARTLAKRTAASRSAATSARGWVRISTRPAYAEVHFRGRRLDTTPCRVQLPVGVQVLKLVNPALGRSTTRRVLVRAEGETTLSVDDFR